MIKITTPNERFNGVRAGLHFSNGVATADALTPRQRASLAGLGYTIEGDEADASQDFEDMTVAELREVAEQNDIDLEGASLKAEILERVQAHLEPEA